MNADVLKGFRGRFQKLVKTSSNFSTITNPPKELYCKVLGRRPFCTVHANFIRTEKTSTILNPFIPIPRLDHMSPFF